MKKDDLTKKIKDTQSKEVLFSKEKFGKNEIIKGYNKVKKYCFVRLRDTELGKVEEKKLSISHILEKIKDKDELYQAVMDFIEQEQYNGFAVNLYAKAEIDKKEYNKNKSNCHPHSMGNLSHWQKTNRKQPFP